MLRNYFTFAIRNLLRNKAFSLINISGLALGMSCSLFIFLWIWDEENIDSFHANAKNLYKVYETWQSGNDGETNYGTPGLLAEELKRKIPEIKDASSLMIDKPPYFVLGDKKIKLDGGFAT